MSARAIDTRRRSPLDRVRGWMVGHVRDPETLDQRRGTDAIRVVVHVPPRASAAWRALSTSCDGLSASSISASSALPA